LTQRRRAWSWGVVFAVVLFAFGGAVGYCARIFPAVANGEQLNAVAAILRGLIGAGGAALAVYLTIDGQRRDEAQKVEAALRMEVAEFGRLAPLPLYLLSQRVIAEHAKIPARDLPVLVAMPEAIVYRETADRISRLPCTLRLAQLSPHALRTARRTTILIAWNCVISDISWQSPRKGIFLARQYELG
jgi:hypothetical protein